MQPDPNAALQILSQAYENGVRMDKWDLLDMISQSLGLLRGYVLPQEVLAGYVCKNCGVKGVKLWRTLDAFTQTWCASCGLAQADLNGLVDADGRRQSAFGFTDQFYTGKSGHTLVPFVPTPSGLAWGYMSVPPEGVTWWRALPTYQEQP